MMRLGSMDHPCQDNEETVSEDVFALREQLRTVMMVSSRFASKLIVPPLPNHVAPPFPALLPPIVLFSMHVWFRVCMWMFACTWMCAWRMDVCVWCALFM